MPNAGRSFIFISWDNTLYCAFLVAIRLAFIDGYLSVSVFPIDWCMELGANLSSYSRDWPSYHL